FDSHDGKQFLHGIARAAFLPEPEQTAHEDDHQNDESIYGVTQEERHARSEEENQGQRILELSEQEGERVRPFRGFQGIKAIAREPFTRFVNVQSVLRRIELPQQFVNRETPEW